VLVQLDDVKVLKLSLGNLRHDSDVLEVGLNFVDCVGQQHACRCPK